MEKTGLVCVMALAAMLAGCTQKVEKKEEVRTVKTTAAGLYGEQKTVSFPGKVRASAEADMAFRVGGQILRVHAKTGQQVREGQLLAELDPRDYEVQLAATKAEYDLIKKDVERIVSLHEKGSVTDSEYDRAVSGLQQIEAKYDAHKNALADTRLYAPFSGYVQKRMHDKGETISVGMPVFSLVSTTNPEVEINIPASNFIERDNFGDFSCTVEYLPGEVFPVKLIGISRKANMNQLFTARFLIEGDGPMPSPGMTATVRIAYKPAGSMQTVIPMTALFEKDGSSTVWLYDQASGTVSARPVTLYEIRADGSAVVSAGLVAGDAVVTAGIHSLKEGQRVRELEQPSSTNVGGML